MCSRLSNEDVETDSLHPLWALFPNAGEEDSLADDLCTDIRKFDLNANVVEMPNGDGGDDIVLHVTPEKGVAISQCANNGAHWSLLESLFTSNFVSRRLIDGLLSISQDFAPKLTATDVAKRYVELLSRTLKFDCCSVYLWDDHRERLALVASTGYESSFENHIYASGEMAMTLEIAKKGLVIHGDRSDLTKRQERGEIDFSRRCDSYIEAPEGGEKTGLRNFLGLPIEHSGYIMGVLKFENTSSQRPKTITNCDIALAKLSAKLLASDLSTTSSSFVKTKNEKMLEQLKLCRDLATRPGIPILLTGRKGCGKQLFAKYIHCWGPMRDLPFRRIDCRELVSSQDRDVSRMISDFVNCDIRGNHNLSTLFPEVPGGTLFFDNILELDENAKESFPSLIERIVIERPYLRVIASIPEELDGRVTDWEKPEINCLLTPFVGSTISIPRLRDRTEDILLLVRHWTEELFFRKGQGLPPRDLEHELSEFKKNLIVKMRERKGSLLEAEELRTIVERACLLRKPLADMLNNWETPLSDVQRKPIRRMDDDDRRMLITDLLRRKKEEGWSKNETARRGHMTVKTLDKYVDKYDLKYESKSAKEG